MPTLNQTGELNAIFWWTIRWVSSALKVCEVGVGREVVLGLGPGRDRVDDAVDELADGGLALGRAEVAAEVLADDDVGGELAPEVGIDVNHDVGGELAPEVGDLDVLLLEDALARFVGDAGGPVLPGDLVVGMDVRAGPAALEGQAAGALAGEAGAVRAGEAGRGGGGPVGGCGPAAWPSRCGHGLRPVSRSLEPSALSPRRLRCRCGVAAASRLRRCYRVVLGAVPDRRTGPAGNVLGVSVRSVDPSNDTPSRGRRQPQNHKM